MKTELFDIPRSPMPRLLAARKRLERAEKAIQRAESSDERFDGFGKVPSYLKEDLAAARKELFEAELEERFRQCLK